MALVPQDWFYCATECGNYSGFYFPWSQYFQFSSAVAKAWILQQGELSEVSLFDHHNVPALGEDEGNDNVQDNNDSMEAALYMGKYSSPPSNIMNMATVLAKKLPPIKHVREIAFWQEG